MVLNSETYTHSSRADQTLNVRVNTCVNARMIVYICVCVCVCVCVCACAGICTWCLLTLKSIILCIKFLCHTFPVRLNKLIIMFMCACVYVQMCL